MKDTSKASPRGGPPCGFICQVQVLIGLFHLPRAVERLDRGSP